MRASSPDGTEPPLPGAKPGKQAADLFPCYRAGVHYVSAERFQPALKELTRAARLAPEDPRPQFHIGQVYKHLQLVELEELAYRRALRIDPDFHDATVCLARVWCDVGRNEKAVEVLQAVHKADPNKTIVWGELALNYRHLGRYEEAIRLLEQFNETVGKHDQDWGYANLGRAYAAVGKLRQAEAAYREAIAINPYFELVHLWFGQLLITTGRKPEADRMLKKFRELRRLQTKAVQIKSGLLGAPDNITLLLELGETRNLLGKPRDALVSLNRCLDLQPKNVRALVGVAHALTLLKKPEAALNPLRQAVEIQPGNEKLRELYNKRRRAVERGKRGFQPPPSP